MAQPQGGTPAHQGHDPWPALGQPRRAVLHCAAALAHRARLRSHRGGQPPDDRVAVGLYAIMGAMLRVSWMIFFHVPFRHPELLEDSVDETFFLGERVRAFVGALHYA